jgi:hypothetical protein
MALSLTYVKDWPFQPFGAGRGMVIDIKCDTSYPSGGYTITPAQLGITGIIGGWIVGGNTLGARYDALFETSGLNGKLHVGQGGGIESYGFGAAKGGEEPAAADEITDRAAAGVNPALVAALVTFTVAAGTVPVTANRPDVPRNVVVWIDNTTGGALSLGLGTLTFTVTGKFRGVTQTDLITFTEDAGHQSIATTKFRGKVGVLPFDLVTGITYAGAAPAGALSVEVGYGIRFGLPQFCLNLKATDILKLVVNDIDLTVSGIVTDAMAANSTVLCHATTLADSPAIIVNWKANSEAPAGTDLSLATFRAFIFGA